MINFLQGSIEVVAYDYIVINVNNVGFQVYVSKPEEYPLYSNVKVLTYLQVKEDDFVLFGFKNKEEKELFLKIISVKGIGPKGAINMLSKTSVDSFIQAIETTNTSFLKKLPGVGPKAAQQLILDLKGQLKFDNDKINNVNTTVLIDAKEALKGLGFKTGEIDNALSKLNGQDLQLDECIFKALQLLRR